MSSSDSDDCYGNAALKFRNMMKKYNEDQIETTSILATKTEDSNAPTTDVTQKPDNEDSEVDEEGMEILERLLKEAEAKKSVVTRSRAKKERQAVLGETDSNSSDIYNDSGTNTGQNTHRNRGKSSTGRGRGRSRTPRGRTLRGRTPRGRTPRGRSPRQVIAPRRVNLPRYRNIVSNLDDIPTYSIGNTHEYPDQCHTQELFKSVTDTVLVEDNSDIAEDEEISVKVYWQSWDYFRFIMKEHQPFIEIFEFFSNKENVSKDKLLFTYNEKIITPSDTPNSINYNFVKFIDGGITNQSVDLTANENVRNGIKIKFQCQNVKRPFETIISVDEKMSVAMARCAEHFEMPINSLVFEFDGDCISGKSTPRQLEMEGGECVDVRIFR